MSELPNQSNGLPPQEACENTAELTAVEPAVIAPMSAATSATPTNNPLTIFVSPQDWVNGYNSLGMPLPQEKVDAYRLWMPHLTPVPLAGIAAQRAQAARSASRPALPRHTELVGSELKRLIKSMELDRLVPDPTSCGCDDLAAQMDSWGADGCEKNADYIVAKINENAEKVELKDKLRGGLRLINEGVVINPLDPTGSLVRAAIRRVRHKVSSDMRFAYAVMTCESRFDTYLPRTVASLAAAGFDRPTLFIDGSLRCTNKWQLPQVVRQAEPLGPFGAWMSCVWSLFTSAPDSDRFIIFQDDIVASLGLREFLEKREYPYLGYCNLCTYPDNASRAHNENTWYPSNQLGLGAQALMFSNEAMAALLSSPHLAKRIADKGAGPRKRRWKYIDGAVSTAMKDAGYREFVSDPSLVYHTGDTSSIANKKQPQTALFKGEDFDLRTLLT